MTKYIKSMADGMKVDMKTMCRYRKTAKTKEHTITEKK